MDFAGIQKTTLIDYPGKVAATVFTYGCNFRCPFCHNPELVVNPSDKDSIISGDEILKFLNKRKGLLDALVVTGGEPLLHDDLAEFLIKVKEIGYLIKVDTNGSFPEKIIKLQKLGIVDYWAMDIKNSEEKYLETSGLGIGVIPDVDRESIVKNIKKSISLIMNSGVDYEFRTTVVPDLHTEDSMHGIGKLINGAKKYFIQNFRSGKTLDKSYSDKPSFTPAELQNFENVMKNYVEKVEIRGV